MLSRLLNNNRNVLLKRTPVLTTKTLTRASMVRFASTTEPASSVKSKSNDESMNDRPSSMSGKKITLAVLSGAALAWGYIYYRDNYMQKAPQFISVTEELEPFLAQIGPSQYPLKTTYSLLGHGVRSVTFINFKAYGLAIYAADKDMKLIPKILNSNFLKKTFIDTDPEKSHSENVKLALEDPVKSVVLIRNLLDSGIRMCAKLTPIKSTNLTFVRESTIKTLWNHPDAEANKEVLSKGIDQLRKGYSKKGSFSPNDDLVMELNADGSLQFYYYNNKTKETFDLGLVTEPLVGRFLFSQYMSGPKPLSQETKDAVVEKISTMV
ncbi:hypothetical protein KAFR_0B06900 [Kazachstania africana CBS 2517]|uniref:Altered inheritance of mitochondria protein 18, mitochondrial n=1 Tax=Kazachstania africana (strain ATCC 22294 / BCRC 22015 / CBS 2517 / CECT 1963 / NBRC 1671 / NRRL Y-8276) TaxID=1071382 RepID=H2ARI7_KAZAF|nr:hypothetical protein KAFR_0B06900 [Kazachstania africana CBS 2517]CCF56987.1 hypothetical protein KAFR_0B06900 [Kazachstania africana CBS 2517]